MGGPGQRGTLGTMLGSCVKEAGAQDTSAASVVSSSLTTADLWRRLLVVPDARPGDGMSPAAQPTCLPPLVPAVSNLQVRTGAR